MKNKIKVLFFIDSFRIGGMHRQIFYLVKHLNREVFEPIMCTSSPEGGFRGDYEKTGCKLIDLGWERPLDPKTVYRLIKVLYSQDPDIVFISEAQNLFYYRLANLFWFKKAYQIGSFRALSFWKGHLNSRYQIIDNLFSKWLYSTSDAVVVNSLSMKEHYTNIINIDPSNPLQTIYNGSDFEFPVSRSRKEIKQELGISVNDKIVIMVARLDPWKDFETILNAARIVSNKNTETKFILVGDGELKKKIKSQISRMGLCDKVLLIGEKKDVYNYINAADISVLSTHGEGFSNSILESMALKKPVVATNVGGNSEIIGNIEDVGLLVPPKSPKLFANSLLKLLNNKNLRISMGKKGQIKIQKMCSINNLVSSYEKLFKHMFNN